MVVQAHICHVQENLRHLDSIDPIRLLGEISQRVADCGRRLRGGDLPQSRRRRGVRVWAMADLERVCLVLIGATGVGRFRILEVAKSLIQSSIHGRGRHHDRRKRQGNDCERKIRNCSAHVAAATMLVRSYRSVCIGDSRPVSYAIRGSDWRHRDTSPLSRDGDCLH